MGNLVLKELWLIIFFSHHSLISILILHYFQLIKIGINHLTYSLTSNTKYKDAASLKLCLLNDRYQISRRPVWSNLQFCTANYAETFKIMFNSIKVCHNAIYPGRENKTNFVM